MTEVTPETKRTRRAIPLDAAKEAQAVRALRESLAAVDADDEALLLDTIEGETSLFEVIDALLARMSANRAMVEGTAVVVSDLATRGERFARRIEADRALIEQAMSIAELDKLERPVATLSMSKRSPKVEISEEADVPAQYWRTPDPVLDKKAVGEALKARKAAIDNLPLDPAARAEALAALPPGVPGAHLSNAAPSLTIRPK